MDASAAGESYDFIIVGAGSAGCVLAERLTASGTHTVLLIEAGPRDRNPWIHIPIGYAKLFNDRRVNWAYDSEPEPHLNGRRIFNPRGKVLGGSSSINGLVYIRGQREDFDGWRDAGNPGWGFDELLPYFKRAENQTRGPDQFHGTLGPLTVSDPSEPHPLCDAFIAGAEEAGFPRNPDFNGPTQEGAGYYQFTLRGRRRASTAVAYLKPALKRPNLKVVTEALLTRILSEGRRAVGVEYRRDGVVCTARARGEVIVSGGAINTPQILQLSGIGPLELLRRLGIAPVLPLEGVGRSYQDHLQVRIVLKCSKPLTLNDEVASLRRKAIMGLRYILFGKGSLTIGAGYAGGFFRTSEAVDQRPDMQCHFLLFSVNKMGESLHPFSGFSASGCQLRPESRGEVMAASPDPAAPPSIRANFLAAEKDRKVHVAALRLLRRILATPSMQAYVAEEYEPGVGVQSDEELLAYCRARGSTIYHPTSTCRMGTDPLAVVDHRLKLRGLEGLRVVDASVLPSVTSGNTNAAVIAIAEKASELILAEAR
ncbi:MAG TPA: choline dehydrogenase [Alphaproteobacteria bacterium]|nr:choline dehydrogenase [Alphaproteobacteria bacterium]